MLALLSHKRIYCKTEMKQKDSINYLMLIK